MLVGQPRYCICVWFVSNSWVSCK